MNITVFGAGYVGLSNAVFLAEHNDVNVIDINEKKISSLQSGKAPIKDSLIKEYLLNKKLSLSFDSSIQKNLNETEIVIIATPTDFNNKNKSFDTSSIDLTLKNLKQRNFSKLVIIRSTVPVGYTAKKQKEYPMFEIAFFPEFLREGKALYDCKNPSRIICGSLSNKAKTFIKLLQENSEKKNIPVKITPPSEAEAIKLFSNAYLALRVAYFNELDSFSIEKNLNTKKIIEGVSLDPRIGEFYNNPSFGYGGYCLPKDTLQIENQFDEANQSLIKAITKSNKIRKRFITEQIFKRKIKNIGIYRLSMKTNSDNFRDSAIIDVIKFLKKKKLNISIFEPAIKTKTFLGLKIESNFNQFIKNSNLIIANRVDKRLIRTNKNIFSRDLFYCD